LGVFRPPFETLEWPLVPFVGSFKPEGVALESADWIVMANDAENSWKIGECRLDRCTGRVEVIQRLD